LGVISPKRRIKGIIIRIEKTSASIKENRELTYSVIVEAKKSVANTFTIMFPVNTVTSRVSGDLKKRRTIFSFHFPRTDLSFSLSRLLREKKAVSDPEKNAERNKKRTRNKL
jgi:hypothetical protein